MRRFGILFVLLVLAPTAFAQPALRYGTVQRGEIKAIGNTLAQECNIGAPAPLSGLVTSCGGQVTDSSPDVFWRSDSPAAGQAEAGTAVTAQLARSTATLFVSSGAGVTKAFLYWSARATFFGNSVTLERPGVFSATATSQAVYAVLPDNTLYLNIADVTEIVQQHRSGDYRVSGVSANEIANVNQAIGVAAWWLVVVTSDPTLQNRSMTLWDGFPFCQDSNTQLFAPLLAFTDPGTSTLLVAGADGDPGVAGDTIAVEGVAISNTTNPINDIFNGTRTRFGLSTTGSTDRPWQSGGIGSMSGFDLDEFDITSRLTVGQSTATITLTSAGDEFWPMMLALSVPSSFVPPVDNMFENGFE